MNIEQALLKIADTFNLNGNELIDYAYEDEIGGYHSNPKQADWPIGNIWEVEGKVLYALVRATKPKRFSCDTDGECADTHIGTAVTRNGNAAECQYRTWGMQLDFVFIDNVQRPDEVASVLVDVVNRLNPGGFIVIHDATHFLVGPGIDRGIQQSGLYGVLFLDIQPSDCGLAVWRKPNTIDVESTTDPAVYHVTPAYDGWTDGEVDSVSERLHVAQQEGEAAATAVREEWQQFVPPDDPAELETMLDTFAPDEDAQPDLDNMSVAELRHLAKEWDINVEGLRKPEIRERLREEL